jgi:hypothetical protein
MRADAPEVGVDEATSDERGVGVGQASTNERGGDEAGEVLG